MYNIHLDDSRYLFAHHEAFQSLSCKIGCSTAAAAFLILGAVIVIGGASLCLTLPGVNAITDVVIPGILPGALALILSTPFIAYSLLHAEEKNRLHREILDFTIMLFNDNNIKEMEEGKIDFIHRNFFRPEWTKEYGGRLLSDLKERYPDEEEDLRSALDEVRVKLHESRSLRINVD